MQPPLYSAETCRTLLALWAAMLSPTAAPDALAWVAEQHGQPIERPALTLVNAIERGCNTCLEGIAARCGEPPK